MKWTPGVWRHRCYCSLHGFRANVPTLPAWASRIACSCGARSWQWMGVGAVQWALSQSQLSLSWTCLPEPASMHPSYLMNEKQLNTTMLKYMYIIVHMHGFTTQSFRLNHSTLDLLFVPQIWQGDRLAREYWFQNSFKPMIFFSMDWHRQGHRCFGWRLSWSLVWVSKFCTKLMRYSLNRCRNV